MDGERSIQRVENAHGKSEKLRSQLERARLSLAEAEADLAGEQAAVNAFRMHCRLKMDDLVDRLSALRSEKEALLVNLELLRQGVDPAYLDEDDPLSDDAWYDDAWYEEAAGEEEVLLPTETPGDKAAEKRLFRELARRFHPDLASSAVEQSYRTTIMSAVNNAYAEGDTEALYDLAGEVAPNEVADLAQISDTEVRQMRRSISKMRRLESKAKRQLAALRQENTARLWRRAQALDEVDEDGWSRIRRELELAITRRGAEIHELRDQIEQLSAKQRQDND